MSSTSRTRSRWALTTDGALGLEIERGMEPFVRRWLPTGLPTTVPDSATEAMVVVAPGLTAGHPERRDPDRAALLTLGSVEARAVGDGSRTFDLVGRGGASGRIDLAGRRAELHAPAGDDGDAVARDLYSMLTLSAALLLGALGRTLVHAGAVVEPGGGTWLLVGDARSGKSTTVATLIAEGWDYLSDDQVVIHRPVPDGPPRVDGWLRPFHLDERWERGEPGGRRRSVSSASLGPGRRLSSAPAAGLIFPTVCPDRPTRLSSITGAGALALLIRQTPWLVALPRERAARVLTLLRESCRLPTYRLCLGRDTFRDGSRLLEILEPATGRRPRPAPGGPPPTARAAGPRPGRGSARP